MIAVIIAIVLVGIFVVSSGMLSGVARYVRGAQSRASALKPFDIVAFATLLDREDELFLRNKLPLRVFTRLKRQRVRLTLRYVARLAANAAAILQQHKIDWQVAQGDAELDTKATAILDLATRIRLECFAVSLKLAIELIFPSLQFKTTTLVPHYRALRESMAQLQEMAVGNSLGLVSPL
jgi:hypothetical protein